MKIKWIDGEREPKCAPNPNYPNGVDVDLRSNRNAPACKTNVPYPAARCGYYEIECPKCGLRVMVTTAGRRDDPRSLQTTCKMS
jgi:DNA-directed RNA polymerase subunit RPC12/RpoP